MGCKTFIICGNFRGGTTAVAQLLARLHIPMGEEMDPNNNFEDLPFQQLLIQDTVDREALHALIQARNENYTVWGFKFPGAHVHMPEILEYFRNPHLIFVFRDPYAVAESEKRRTGQSLAVMMERTVEYNLHMTRLLHQAQYPAHPVSYEHLLVQTELVVDGLLEFLQMSPGWYEKRKLIKSIRMTKDRGSYGYKK